MRNKLIMITAMLAVMVAMTGIAAAAEQIQTVTANTIIPDNTLALSTGGQSTALDIRVYDMSTDANTPHELSVTVYDSAGVVTTTGLKISVDEKELLHTGLHPSGIYPTDSNPIVKWAQDQPGPNADEILDMKVEDIGNVPSLYTILIEDKITGQSFSVSTSVGVTVPEFPTVALPIAAVLGLVFLFQQKKRKEE